MERRQAIKATYFCDIFGEHDNPPMLKSNETKRNVLIRGEAENRPLGEKGGGGLMKVFLHIPAAESENGARTAWTGPNGT
jgi:hypothetical protein